MSNKFLFSLAMTGLLVATAGADGTTTTVESTNLLFSVTASSATIPGTPWTSPTSGTASRTGSTIDVDTAASDPLKYAGTFSGATRYRVKGNMTVTLNAGEPDAFTGNDLPKAALVAVAGSPNKWYGWNGASWVDLSSGITTAPEEGNPYNVAIEFFVANSKLNIKYTVGSLSQTLEHSSDTELPSGAFSVGLAGYGSFGDFAALGFKEYEVTIPEGKLEAACAAMGITDGVTADKLNALGENGLTKWESIVLGLKSSSTKPYTAPVQTSGDALGFTIGNVDTDKYGATGATVTFDVVECNSDGSGEKAIVDESANNVAAGGTATVTAPSGVKYYKIKIKITK